jgi:hypothetical protein
MFAILKMSGKYYATKKSLSVDKIDKTVEYIESFTGEGTPVILAEDLEDVAEMLNIEVDEIIIAD